MTHNWPRESQTTDLRVPCCQGGNDYEIFSDPRTIGHSVANPEDTIKQLKALFKLE